MGLLRRLGVGVVSLLALLSTALFAAPLLMGRVQAQSSSAYSYTAVDPAASPTVCTTSQPTGTGGEILAITETSQQAGGSTTTYWCHVPNSTYEFTRGGNSSDRITVTNGIPDQGSLQTGGQNSAINIGNASLLTRQFGGATSTAAASSEASSCESLGNWAWAACPFVSFISGAVNWLDSRIQGILSVDERHYGNDGLKAAWVNFRNIAYIVLIPIMLVMVIGTALGFEIFSAYTVKKALPRMVLAVVFITLSWHITTFMIGFFNVLGAGILGLMTSPFGIGNNMSLETLFGASSSNAGDIASTTASATVQWAAVLGPLVGLVAVATVPGGLAILMLYLLPVVLFVLGAFLVLLLREIFILAGVLLAPVAILAWIFPGNDGLWKLWWNTFSKLLMMFPLIMVIIGAGRIAAHLIDIPQDGGAQSVLNPLLKMTAYVLPYMFIPFAFKFAGGVFANLAGMVNDREKGIFDRLKKGRAEKMAEFGRRGGRNSLHNQERAANAKGLKGRWMRGVNSVGGWIFDPVSNAHIKLGTEKGRAILSQVWQGKAEDSQKLAEVMGRMSFNAEELSALSLGRNIKVRNARGEIEEKWIDAWSGTGKDLYRIADQLSSSTDEQDRIGGRHLRENASFLTQVARNDDYGRAMVKAAAGLAYASQGFATPEELARLSEELGEGGSGVGSIIKTQAELLSVRGGGLGKPGYGVRLDADGRYYAPTGIDGGKIEQLVRTGVQDFSAAKGSQLSGQLKEAIQHVLTAAPDTQWVGADGRTKTIGEIKAGVEETMVQVMGSYAAPDVKRRVYEILVDAKTANLIPAGRQNDADAVAAAKAAAEEEVRRLLQRSSGAIDLSKLNAAEQARLQQEQNEQNQ